MAPDFSRYKIDINFLEELSHACLDVSIKGSNIILINRINNTVIKSFLIYDLDNFCTFVEGYCEAKKITERKNKGKRNAL